MLLIILALSLLSIVIGKAATRVLPFSAWPGRVFTNAGRMGLGFFAGFGAYAWSANMLADFLTGFSAH